MHRRSITVLTLTVCFAALSTQAQSSSAPVTPGQQETATAAAPAKNDYSKPETWLCRGGSGDACTADLSTTVIAADGRLTRESWGADPKPPIDCFYVYPTVSGQSGRNASVAIEPEETQIAIDQASRFSQVCKVYAPIYPQLTIAALNRGEVTPEGVIEAYIGVVTAFDEYLAQDNHGRGFVLIGHSQGSAMLERLIKEQIDPNPALRQRLVSAVLPGGGVTVPTGQRVGGSFQNVPTCQAFVETGCVIAYSSFLEQPPPGALFGRPEGGLGALGGNPGGPGFEVACVNPALLAQGGASGPLFSYYSTSPFPGPLGVVVQVPKAPTPWVATPGQYSGRCERAAGATWLQLTPSGPPGDTREPILETLGPLWGTHLVDVNVALGNLVATVGAQSAAYELGAHL
jgi:hypothetical protein